MKLNVFSWLLMFSIVNVCFANSEQMSGVMLVYVEQEQGVDPLTTELFVTADYLRISDHQSGDDFILFDRKEQTIYNVTYSQKNIFVIKAKTIDVEPPIALDFKEQAQPSAELPKIDGRAVNHHRYYANGVLCYETIVFADDFLPEARKAMYEFKQVLAGEHATTVSSIPKSMLDPCDLALNIFYAGENLKRGLPVREWAPDGYQRYLQDYVPEASMPKSAFSLPAGFERFSIGDLLIEPGKAN